ncbi:hypothetical protein Moror_2695 [Moniliophthora roreri MCA 2997]|uniref:Uncharacterized protein n=1 Tax=Moniliophthora roreri (strain MCA 2997) TaxID=1381753 RepID=V2XCH7_MONRO|nr:hypothetical protein Moror_2695 [Moniliophthora roreri MCA 2997]
MSSANLERAAKLKDEGNTLFARKEFKAANQKYTEAIVLDDKNPILYANRAACRLSLKKYLDASQDASKATELDPTYAKAWARLATAQDFLAQRQNSVKFWRKAVEALLKENLTEAEKKQKQQYEAGLAAAIDAEKALQKGIPVEVPIIQREHRNVTPWMVAMSMLPQLQLEGNDRSSAWIISSAYRDFEEANRKMQPIRHGRHETFDMSAMEHLSNALLTDQRCFHIADPTWIQKFTKQVQAQTVGMRGWTFDSFDNVFAEVEKRLENEGWDATRRALSTTTRCWIALGHLDMGLKRNAHSNLEFLDRVIKTILWGQKKWSHVSYEHRGVIFRESFLRGVRNLRLEALLQIAGEENTASGKVEALEEILREAETIIKSVEKDTAPPDPNPVFRLAYHDYPCAHAYALKGYYYREKAKLSKDGREESKFCMEAGKAYMIAASKYPEDDENNAWFLHVAVDCLAQGDANPKLTLEALEKLQAAIPRMQKIWALSSLAIGGRDVMIETTLSREQELRNRVKD